METAQEFVERDDVRRDLDGEYRTIDADAIRARDNAVRLALLDEIGWMRGTWESRLIAARDKYSQPGSQDEPRFCGKCGAQQEQHVKVGPGHYRTVG